jgi:hypothetical protein
LQRCASCVGEGSCRSRAVAEASHSTLSRKCPSVSSNSHPPAVRAASAQRRRADALVLARLPRPDPTSVQSAVALRFSSSRVSATYGFGIFRSTSALYDQTLIPNLKSTSGRGHGRAFPNFRLAPSPSHFSQRAGTVRPDRYSYFATFPTGNRFRKACRPPCDICISSIATCVFLVRLLRTGRASNVV